MSDRPDATVPREAESSDCRFFGRGIFSLDRLRSLDDDAFLYSCSVELALEGGRAKWLPVSEDVEVIDPTALVPDIEELGRAFWFVAGPRESPTFGITLGPALSSVPFPASSAAEGDGDPKSGDPASVFLSLLNGFRAFCNSLFFSCNSSDAATMCSTVSDLEPAHTTKRDSAIVRLHVGRGSVWMEARVHLMTK